MFRPISPEQLPGFGYYVVKGIRREFAGCRSVMLPDYDAIPTGNHQFCAETLAAKWGIEPAAATALFGRNQALWDAGKIIFFAARYTELDAALGLKREFFAARADIHVIGVGMPRETATYLADTPDFRPLPPLSPGGTFCGFDLYGIDSLGPIEGTDRVNLGLGCPFHCCDWDNQVVNRLGIKVNADGFFPTLSGARRGMAAVNRECLGEPYDRYLPFAVVEYGA